MSIHYEHLKELKTKIEEMQNDFESRELKKDDTRKIVKKQILPEVQRKDTSIDLRKS